MADDIVVEEVDNWVEITINRPEKLNAIREQSAIELLDALADAESRSDLVGVILKGSERAFCAGVDTSEQKDEGDKIFELWRRRKRSRKVNQLVRTLPEFSKPIIAVVEGYALGGGFEIALLCDFIIAGERAQFGLPEAKLGLIPGCGGTITLARVVGKPMAKELIWTGRRVTAEEAKALRIVNHVTPAGDAIGKAREVMRAIADVGPLSVMFSKQAIERGSEAALREGLAMESDAFFAISMSNDRNEGLAAFREKRQPTFKGN